MKLFLLLAVTTVSAHEIGTTRVTFGLDGPGRYAIEIAADAESLSEKLTGQEQKENLEALFRAQDARFRTRVKLSFDGVAAPPPEITYRITPRADANSAILATIRLTGPVPPGARALTWYYGWTFSTYTLKIADRTEWLEGGATSAPIPLERLNPPSRLETAWRYFVLGFTHILPLGLDHVLFVLGLYFLNSRFRSVLWQASAFTLAHSITLGLSLYGWLKVPASIVEPLIALSIAYVAIENVLLSELKPWRVVLVFAFGLLHGMGFAGVLEEIGMPRSEFVLALVNFNLGVEGGQIAVIAIAFLVTGWKFADRQWYRARIAVPASVLIACMAVYWTIERLS